MYCRNCGKELPEGSSFCPNCGAQTSEHQVKTKRKKNRIVAALLALTVGGFGIHRFYLGHWWGIFYILFIWTYIPLIASLIEGLVFAFMSDETFDSKYNT